MPVTIIKKDSKVKKVAKTKAKNTPLLEKLDRMGELKAEIDYLKEQMAPYAKEFSALESEVLPMVDEITLVNDKNSFVSDNYITEFGAKAKSTDINDIGEVFEEIGEEAFSKIAKVGITDLRKATTGDQFEKLTTIKQEGKRKIKFTKKA